MRSEFTLEPTLQVEQDSCKTEERLAETAGSMSKKRSHSRSTLEELRPIRRPRLPAETDHSFDAAPKARPETANVHDRQLSEYSIGLRSDQQQGSGRMAESRTRPVDASCTDLKLSVPDQLARYDPSSSTRYGSELRLTTEQVEY
jgi:hypothetical protein